MTQKSMAELFDVQVPAITKHIKNIYDSGELQKYYFGMQFGIIYDSVDAKKI